MKKIIVAILGIILAVGLFFGISMYMEYSSSSKGTGEIVEIEILQGQGAWEIADTLKDAGLIRYRTMFCLKAHTMGANAQLRYGSFSLYKNAGLESLINDLITGGAKKEEIMFTVPEGYTIELIAKKLEDENIFSGEEFLFAVSQNYDYWFLESIPENADVRYRLQGFLFPETYAIAEDASARDLVDTMLKHFGEKYTKEMEEKARALGKTTYEVITEASLIQRETGIDSERKTIAGVIENRMEVGMRLQIDPTFLYPLTNGLYNIDKATYEHTKLESPYNTYQIYGLPVGPIACPGLPSIEAALDPEEHNYYYYHTDETKGDGSHIFTETYEEHLTSQ